MKEKLKPFIDINLPIQQLIFNWIAMAGIAAGTVSGTFMAVVRNNMVASGIALSIAAIMLLCIYIANYHDMLKQATYCVCFLIIVIALPELYLLIGGV